jgi:hypothetical protein
MLPHDESKHKRDAVDAQAQVFGRNVFPRKQSIYLGFHDKEVI